jgi:hypothetical protein
MKKDQFVNFLITGSFCIEVSEKCQIDQLLHCVELELSCGQVTYRRSSARL